MANVQTPDALLVKDMWQVTKSLLLHLSTDTSQKSMDLSTPRFLTEILLMIFFRTPLLKSLKP